QSARLLDRVFARLVDDSVGLRAIFCQLRHSPPFRSRFLLGASHRLQAGWAVTVVPRYFAPPEEPFPLRTSTLSVARPLGSAPLAYARGTESEALTSRRRRSPSSVRCRALCSSPS